MDIEKIYIELISLIDTSKVFKNENMKKHTTFKIGGNADILVKATTIEDIKNVLKIVKTNNVPLYVIGNGSNILVKDNGIRGIVLVVCIDIFQIEEKENQLEVTVGAGVKLIKLANDLLKQNVSGFEFASRNSWNSWWCNKNECRCTWN